MERTGVGVGGMNVRVIGGAEEVARGCLCCGLLYVVVAVEVESLSEEGLERGVAVVMKMKDLLRRQPDYPNVAVSDHLRRAAATCPIYPRLLQSFYPFPTLGQVFPAHRARSCAFQQNTILQSCRLLSVGMVMVRLQNFGSRGRNSASAMWFCSCCVSARKGREQGRLRSPYTDDEPRTLLLMTDHSPGSGARRG
jgi:hypothetical protein